MTLLSIEITARSPLTFPERKPNAQFRCSLGYVPGAAIYGALGLRLGEKWQDEQQEFDRKLFHAIRCHNAYPAWPEDRWSRPVPTTAEQPKGADESPSMDTLIDRICWERLQPAALVFSPTDEQGRAWEADRGFYSLPVPNDIREQIKRSVSQRVLTRVSINRRRGTAEDQLLYSPLALSERNTCYVYTWDRTGNLAREKPVKRDFASRFLGSAVVPDDYDHADLISELNAITHLGGRTTSGLGHVQIQAYPQAPETADAVCKRVEALTAAFRDSVALYESLGGTGWKAGGAIFTVNLLSDAILYDDDGHPTMIITAEMLRKAAGLESKLTLLRSFASYSYTGGWHVQWERHKPSAVSTLMGSVFVFQAEDGLSTEDCQHLADLQINGIGERRAEGYGQVRVCDEFHLNRRRSHDERA